MFIKEAVLKSFARPVGFLGRLASWSMDFFHRIERKETLGLLELRPGMSVLEIGFNTGKMIRPIVTHIAPNGFYTGIDIVATHKSKLAKQFLESEIELIKADIESYDFKKKYDRIFMIHVFYFFKDPKSLLKKLYATLHPGGRIVLAHAKQPQSTENDKHIFRNRYDGRAFIELLQALNFQEINVKHVSAWGQDLIFVTAIK